MDSLEQLKFQRGILLLLLLLVAPLEADIYTTDYTEGIHPSYWNITTNSGLYEIDDSQGDIRISKPYGGTYSFQYVSIGFKQQVNGDFDVTVDYRDAQINRVDGSPGNQVQLNASFGGQAFCVVRSDEAGFPGGDNRHVWASPPTAWFGAKADTSLSGTMRITRMGTVVTGYIDNEPIYSKSYNTATAKFSFVIQNNGTKDAVSITYDNFTLIADEIVSYPGDINHDNCVNLIDYALLASEWLNTDCSLNNGCNSADQNNSGTVDFKDLDELVTHWLICVEI